MEKQSWIEIRETEAIELADAIYFSNPEADSRASCLDLDFLAPTIMAARLEKMIARNRELCRQK